MDVHLDGVALYFCLPPIQAFLQLVLDRMSGRSISAERTAKLSARKADGLTVLSRRLSGIKPQFRCKTKAARRGLTDALLIARTRAPNSADRTVCRGSLRTRIQPFDAIGNLVERGQQEPGVRSPPARSSRSRSSPDPSGNIKSRTSASIRLEPARRDRQPQLGTVSSVAPIKLNRPEARRQDRRRLQQLECASIDPR